MKEAFETMSSHPLLTIFLGIISIISLIILTDTIIRIIDVFKK